MGCVFLVIGEGPGFLVLGFCGSDAVDHRIVTFALGRCAVLKRVSVCMSQAVLWRRQLTSSGMPPFTTTTTKESKIGRATW